MFKLFIPALAALSLAGTAHAEELDRVSIAVSYADLNLASGPGAATLHQRIEAAATKACSRAWLAESRSSTGWKKCYADALDDAARQIAEAKLPVQFVADNR